MIDVTEECLGRNCGGVCDRHTVREQRLLPCLADSAANRADDGWTRMVLNACVHFLTAYLGGSRMPALLRKRS